MTSCSLKACMHVLAFRGGKNSQGHVGVLQQFGSLTLGCVKYNDRRKTSWFHLQSQIRFALKLLACFRECLQRLPASWNVRLYWRLQHCCCLWEVSSGVPVSFHTSGGGKSKAPWRQTTLNIAGFIHLSPPVIHARVSFTRRCRSAFCRRDGTSTDGGTQREWERTAVSSKCNGWRDWSQNSASIISQPKLMANLSLKDAFKYVRSSFTILN